MKNNVFFLLITLLFLLNACNSHPTNIGNREDNDSIVIKNKINRDKTISFLGIRLGLPNKRLKSVINSLDNVIITDVPDFINRHYFEYSMFCNYKERLINAFCTSIIGENNDRYEGWGMALSDVDSITRIHFIIKTHLPDSVFNNIKIRYVNQYGDPDEEYENYSDKSLQGNYGCYWEFINDQRIYLNKFIT